MKMTTMKLCLGFAVAVFAGNALAAEPAFKVFGTTVSMDEVAKDKQVTSTKLKRRSSI